MEGLEARLTATPNLTPHPRGREPNGMATGRSPQAGWVPGWEGEVAGWQVKREMTNEVSTQRGWVTSPPSQRKQGLFFLILLIPGLVFKRAV